MPTIRLKQLRRLLKDQAGVTLVETGVALTLAIVVGSGALLALGNSVSPIISAAGEQMPH
ncbi:Flp family type IVb pilin [Seohaeicola zhoushanensis]|uniref:Uncharacterized protein n=1 Tax=Seohaeicola zhoushanensis TaxID=1569283 RepID=A0A8J3H073_9RHOB|nr:Flp family type IVb pilin [Seohaeicola zhoushanensis]GHF58947.1 hypothetical protein GCM10017056_32990 [Seohaeicola zhoushanensis]